MRRPHDVGKLLQSARRLGRRYYQLTGRPLGITGEIAEYDAVRLLGLEQMPVRQPGYDAIRRENGKITRIQIKSRCLVDSTKPGQRLGQIRLDRPWDSVLVVILSKDLNTEEICEARRSSVRKALTKPGSKSRNVRGALALNQFKRIARRVWPISPQKTDE